LALPPLKCTHSNCSSCALYEPERPAKEWYEQKIKETEGLDDALPAGALAEQQGEQEPAADLRDPTTEYVWLCELTNKNNPTQYIANSGGFGATTSDPYKALRFSNRETATAICNAACARYEILASAVEHGFDYPMIPAPLAELRAKVEALPPQWDVAPGCVRVEAVLALIDKMGGKV